MGTRATYTFKKESKFDYQRRPEITCYIHWDGYPQGAASYFKMMVDTLAIRNNPDKNLEASLRGGALEQFIRGNPLAEITASADMHGDTEFHYDIFEAYNSDTRQQEILVTAYELRWEHYTEKRSKIQFFHGFVDDFIARFPWESVNAPIK